MKPLLPISKAWFATAAILDFLLFLQLFVFTGNTERFFAWTIAAPLSETFLGAAYGVGALLMALSWRETQWAHARIAVPSVLAFTLLTLVVTLLHLDKFHLGTPHAPTALFFGWFWLVVYGVTPVVQALVLLRQAFQPGHERQAHHSLPGGLCVYLEGQAIVLLLIGSALLLFPASLTPWWPWSLTPLTARMIGAWLFGAGLILVHARLDNDRQRVRNGLVIYGLFGLFQLVALVRFAGDVQWQNPFSWLYGLLLLGALAVGIYGWRLASTTKPMTPMSPTQSYSR